MRKGDAAGLLVMAQLVQTAPPSIRMQAHDRLTILAGPAAPTCEPLAEKDTSGLWMKWASAPGDDWQARKSDITIP